MNNIDRSTSIDLTRGFIIFMMVFVNDIGLIKDPLIPDFLVHFSDRYSGSGITFVDLVFPGFLFMVGMSIPFAIHTRLAKGISLFGVMKYIVLRTLSLMMLGLMMAKGWPGSTRMGFTPALWQTMMGLSAIMAFCHLPQYETDPKKKRLITYIRLIGFTGLLFLAFQYIGKREELMLSLFPLRLYINFWGILGIIGWAYAISACIYLIFTTHRTALLGCMVLLLGLFPALQASKYAQLLGTHPAISVAGMLLGCMLFTENDSRAFVKQVRFTVLFILGTALGSLMLLDLYGISKNRATPSWSLFSCAFTGALWLFFHLIHKRYPMKAFASAGYNVILTYLLSSIYYAFILTLGLGTFYRQFALLGLPYALLRAFVVSVSLISFSVFLNKKGFRLRL